MSSPANTKYVHSEHASTNLTEKAAWSISFNPNPDAERTAAPLGGHCPSRSVRILSDKIINKSFGLRYEDTSTVHGTSTKAAR